MLRREAPVFRYERENVTPFWAITRHDDIVDVSRQPDLFRSAQSLFVTVNDPGAPPPDEALLRQLLNMNPPEHGAYRAVVSRRFTPQAVKQLAAHLRDISKQLIDGIADREECDFVTDVSAKLPLAVIADMFGIPQSDWEMMFRLSNAMIGPADPEYSQGGDHPGGFEKARMEFFQYFTQLIEDRRKDPRDDLATALANGRVNEEPIPPFELLSYFALLIIAGNETTRNATTGGLYAFIHHPDQWELFKRDPSLLRSAHRGNPALDLAGHSVHAESRPRTLNCAVRRSPKATCWRCSIRRPTATRRFSKSRARFDITRHPNYHLAFGIAEHFCLGANLARLELQMIFREIAARMERVELTAPIARMRSSFVGGIKHMPIRYRMLAR